MKYFLDHPQIKRSKALGNGSTPKKKEEPEVEMSKKDFVKEHKSLIKTLRSPSKKDDKKEVKKQEAELKKETK